MGTRGYPHSVSRRSVIARPVAALAGSAVLAGAHRRAAATDRAGPARSR